jgi:DEAD/DEAH box helicase domain-containing protein
VSFPTPATVYQDIHDTYLRYIDTAFALRDPVLTAERRALLDGSQGTLFTPLMLEPVLPYDGVINLEQAAISMGILSEAVLTAGKALFKSSDSVSLRDHQIQTLVHHFAAEGPRNIVVTSGTGSGKTEAFLLPVLTRIAMECQECLAFTNGGTTRGPKKSGCQRGFMAAGNPLFAR